MYRDTNEGSAYRQYSDQSNQIDYAHPDYYQTPVEHSEQIVPQIPVYPEYAGGEIPYYNTEVVPEYRGLQQTMEADGADTDAQQDATSQDKPQEGKGRKKGLAGLGGLAVTIGALLFKIKSIALLLQFGWAGVTALISIFVYSFIFGWPFAIGLVVLLFVHELGHVAAMKIKGIPIRGMVFIPMLGAAVSMRQAPQNARDEAEVGIAGPIAGAIAASVCFLFASQPDASPLWASLAYFGFFLNLFNLIPVMPFDGGRVLAAIDRRVWILGFLGLLAFQIWQWVHGQFSPWLLLFVVIAATQLWTRSSDSNTPEGRSYYNVPIATRISLGVLYFGLAAVLVLGMTVSRGLMLGM